MILIKYKLYFFINKMAQNQLQIEDVDNECLREADDYLRKHRILELFEVSNISL